MIERKVVVIGGGSAGIAAAIAADQQGVDEILLIERDHELGGILNQCIHCGFGIHRFKQELTGPEYSKLVVKELLKTKVEVWSDTTVLQITKDNIVNAINERGSYLIAAGAIILAMGCRERTRGAIRLSGSRPAGVYAAGAAQRLINFNGFLPGKSVVIIGSGDIGLIMARRMTLEGAKVEAVVEIMSYSNGLSRNVVQCVDDFGIPLMLKTTVTKIHGKNRVSGVSVAELDDNMQPKKETEKFISCDTVLLSVGLIPENYLTRKAGVELDSKIGGPVVGESRQTKSPGVFACGNVLHVHDLVDFVSEEGEIAGLGAANYLKGKLAAGFTHEVKSEEGVRYVVPQLININNLENKVKIFLRVNKVFEKKGVAAYLGDRKVAFKKELKLFPSEMIGLELNKQALLDNPDCKIITIKVE